MQGQADHKNARSLIPNLPAGPYRLEVSLDPVVNFNAGSFGRITTQAGTPRIIQFGIKFDF